MLDQKNFKGYRCESGNTVLTDNRRRSHKYPFVILKNPLFPRTSQSLK